MFSLEKRIWRGEMIVIYKYLMGTCHMEDGTTLQFQLAGPKGMDSNYNKGTF